MNNTYERPMRACKGSEAALWKSTQLAVIRGPPGLDCLKEMQRKDCGTMVSNSFQLHIFANIYFTAIIKQISCTTFAVEQGGISIGPFSRDVSYTVKRRTESLLSFC